MKLSDKIWVCRKKAGLSQEALAEKIGVSRQAISKWETGDAAPEITKLPLLARTFGVTADWLLDDEAGFEEDAPEEHAPEESAEAPVDRQAPEPVQTYPEWIDHLPGFLGRMLKKYGWLFGVRMAISGALFILPVTGRDLSIISMVALIMLAGTVVNNSIILVDYINVRRDRGESREDAILHACPLRIRPVMMTTITTVLAMVPMALATGDTPEMMTDMCLTMMSGMIISTGITLLFTPVYYSVIDELPKKLRGKFRKKEQPAGIPEELPEGTSEEILEELKESD
mgnify:CR=1 FL=1